MRDSKWLLSDDALPHIDVPQTPVHRMRSFRMPTALVAVDRRLPAVEQAVLHKASEDARFRERTLTWFKIGEELERQEAVLIAEAEADPPRRWRRLAAIGGGAAVLTVALLLLL